MCTSVQRVRFTRPAARPTLELVKHGAANTCIGQTCPGQNLNWSNATRPTLELVKRDTIRVKRGRAGAAPGLTLSGETGYWSKNRILATTPHRSKRILVTNRILVTTQHWSNRILVKQSARQDRVTGAEVGVVHSERRRRLALRARGFVRSLVRVRAFQREREGGGGWEGERGTR